MRLGRLLVVLIVGIPFWLVMGLACCFSVVVVSLVFFGVSYSKSIISAISFMI